MDDAAVGEPGNQLHVRKCRRKDTAANGKDFAAYPNGFGEVPGNVGERGQEKIAEIVADEAASGMKTILEEAAEKSLIFGKGDHAVANVAGRKDTVFAAKAAGTAAVVGYGNNGSELGNRAVRIGMLVAAADDVLLEPAKKRRESGAAAKSNHAESAGESFRFALFFLHRMT